MAKLIWSAELEGKSLYEADVPGMYLITELKAQEMSVEEGWQQRGLFLFAQGGAGEALLAGTAALLRQLGARPRLLWVENGQDAPKHWRTHALLISGEDAVTGQWGWDCPGYRLEVYRGAAALCTKSTLILTLQGGACAMQAPDLRLVGGDTVQVHLDGGALPAGSVTFELTGGLRQQNLFRALGAGIAYALESDPTDLSGRERGYVDLLYSPVLEWNDPLNLAATVYPSELLNPAKTYFSLPADMPQMSHLTNTVEERLVLKTTQDSRLVFQRTPLHLHREGDALAARTRCYLGLSGRFLISQPTTREELELLCGNAGLECVRLPCQPGLVEFVPGGDGFCASDGSLESLGTTPYLSFQAGSLYFSQPECAPLFAPEQRDMPFSHRPTALYGFGEEPMAVPLFPSRSAGPQQARQGESLESALRGARYAGLSTGNLAGPDGEAARAVTPQGLLVGLESETALAAWSWVALGKNPDGGDLRLLGIDGALRTRLQQADLSALFESPEALLEHIAGAENFTLSFSGWRFLLHPSTWRTAAEHPEEHTMLLIKYSARHSVREQLAGHPVFEKALARCYDEEHAPRKEYAEFLCLVEDRSFQGCLFFNCPVDAVSARSQMPPELQIAVAGIGEEALKALSAHHLVLRKSRIESEVPLALERSSLSGLIDFSSGQALAYSREDERPDAQYATTQLLVRLADSRLMQIRCVSELLLNRLFGARCANSADAAGNSLILDGELSTQGGESVFTYRLRSSGSLSLGDGMLRSLTCEAVSLVCREDSGCFHLSGRLYFAAQDACDLFSYGLEADGADRGLPFEELRVEMPQIGGALVVSDRQLALRPQEGEARVASMAMGFPMELTGLCRGDGPQYPEALGYTLIEAPLTQAPLTAPWYGLRWRVPLGSLGELSENSTLDIELLTAWSPPAAPEGGAPGCWLGVKLPPALGGAGLDVQGLLKLGFRSVEILAEKNQAGKICYQMLLNQFTVRALWVSFPPGSTCIRIVPDETGKRLGWFAAYADGEG